MNLKALLVDDEMNILRNLQAVIPWGEMGIDVVGLAKNGVEALAIAEKERPQIVLSDIRMPVMDGITLLQKIREFDSSCEFLLLTGYQDFEYARSAIHLQVKDYILKPIDYEGLQTTIQNIATGIRAEHFKKIVEQKKWGKVKNLAYEKILFDIIMDYASVSTTGVLSEDDDELEKLAYILLVIDMEEYSQTSFQWAEKERKLWNFAVRNVLQEALQFEHLTYAVLQMREGEWCILIEQHRDYSEWDELKASRWANLLRNAVQQNVKIRMNAGVYPELLQFSQLSQAYKRVQRGMNLSLQKNGFLYVCTNSIDQNEQNSSLWDLVEEIVSSLKRGDRQNTEVALQQLNRTLMSVSEQSIVRVEQILHFLVLHLIREMRELNALTGKEEEEVWHKLHLSTGVKDLLSAMNGLVDDCLNTAMSKKSSEMLMLSAKDYIDRHLATDLGIEEIADHLGISCSYFSLLFKVHFKETFVEYLTRQRMELAKSMLRMSNRSIAQICKLVGYAERRYFTKVFQKYAGMPPSEYRELRNVMENET